MGEELLSASPSLVWLSAKAVGRSLPLLRRRGGGSSSGSVGGAQRPLPDPVRLTGVRVSPRRLAAYREICGYPAAAPSERLPVAYPHVLGFALQLKVLTDPLFPFAPLGAVHIVHTITQVRPIGVHEAFDLAVAVGEVRAHPRGQQVSIRTQALVNGEVVWREESVYLSRSRRSPHRTAGPQSPPSADAAEFEAEAEAQAEDPARTERAQSNEPPAPASESLSQAADAATVSRIWVLPADLGRRYARVSGDLNPIHLFDLTARPFGFRSHLAHGMWTLARALAELDLGLSERLEVSVQFRKPLYLPGTAAFTCARSGGQVDFSVSTAVAGDHLRGTITAR